jgi:hypothetical protein
MDRRSTATLICDGAARSCFHTQASLSRSVIGSAGPPGGGSKQSPCRIFVYLAELRSQPAAMKILAGAEPAEPVHRTGDFPTFFRVSTGPGWALAGDARHHKGPFIARGVTDAQRGIGRFGWLGHASIVPQRRGCTIGITCRSCLGPATASRILKNRLRW